MGKAESCEDSHGNSKHLHSGGLATGRRAAQGEGKARRRKSADCYGRNGTTERTKEEPMDKATQARQTGDCTQDGYTPVQGRNGTASAATASESGVSWLDSAALAECRRLTAECAALAERNAELRAALDEQGDELAALRREAASVPTELDGGRLLIVADSIASDADGLRTIEAYGRFFEREDGGRDGWMKLPVDADGVPIRPDDLMACTAFDTNDFDGKEHVMAVGNGFWVDKDGCTHIPSETRHVKERTVEDVLRELADEVWETSCTCQTTWSDSGLDGIEKRYADEIREMLEVK